MHSNFSPDSDVRPEKMAERCEAAGLDLIAVTDHNTIDGALAVRDVANIAVIVGEEVTSAQGEIIGLFLDETIPRGLGAIETAQRIKDQGGLVCIPHPFDRFRRNVISREALNELVPYIDVVEAFNSRNNLAGDDRKAQAFAVEHGLLKSGVTDAHTAIELGRTYVELPDFDITPASLRGALGQATIVGRRVTPLIHAVTTLTKVKKRLLRRTSVRPNAPDRVGPPR